ncbi:MAG: molybdopterin molybdotransferase MoeA [Candidatus Koribacter versatilis]|nr:molybdopterin molybdotransferase MoeA [Candidatus Koribacter versatilis]
MPSRPPAAGIVSFEEARHIVEQHAGRISPGEAETAELLSASGRVLAEPILADRDFPPFPRATRDGYALRAQDVAEVPARLELIGEIKAGDWPAGSRNVKQGQAVAIMTGAPLPAGADAVVMVEYTAQTGISVEIKRSVKSGENFVPRGAEAREGQLLLDRGNRLDHAGIAIAASVGKSKLQVFRRPRIAVLSTGDEIVEIEKIPGPSQIRNSNTYSLSAQIRRAGGEPVRLPIAPDEPSRLRSLIEEGLESDLLLLTGGVSMGKYDLVEQVLAELKAEFYFTGAQIQPGRPIVFGRCGQWRTGVSAPHHTYFFGLPGNPVSTMVTFELFVRPMIQALTGGKPQPLIFLKARLKSEVRTKTGLKRFLPAVLCGEFENAEVELARWQGSGDIAARAGANCYLVIPPDREQISAGEWVSLLLP